MPRLGDYNNCKIYKIISMNDINLVYYGHTCDTLSRRFSRHKSPSNKSTSKQIIDLGDAMIVLVEDFPCNNENQARAKEAFYIQNNPCVNKQIPNRTIKQYYADNHDKILEHQKQYDDAHKEQKKQYRTTNKEKTSEH